MWPVGGGVEMGKIPVTATSEKPHDLAGGLVLPLGEQTASETETQASILYATFNFPHYILYISEMSRRAKLRTLCHPEQIHK